MNIVQAACGGWHCLAVSNTGQAYAWGGNEYGQCGVAQGSRDVSEPAPCLPQHKVQQVAAGGMHTCALTESGRVSKIINQSRDAGFRDLLGAARAYILRYNADHRALLQYL